MHEACSWRAVFFCLNYWVFGQRYARTNDMQWQPTFPNSALLCMHYVILVVYQCHLSPLSRNCFCSLTRSQSLLACLALNNWHRSNQKKWTITKNTVMKKSPYIRHHDKPARNARRSQIIHILYDTLRIRTNNNFCVLKSTSLHASLSCAQKILFVSLFSACHLYSFILCQVRPGISSSNAWLFLPAGQFPLRIITLLDNLLANSKIYICCMCLYCVWYGQHLELKNEEKKSQFVVVSFGFLFSL